MSRIRVQFIIGQLTYGGSERHLVDTVLHLDQDRYQPQVICLGKNGPLARPLLEAGVHYREVPVVGFGLPGHKLSRAVRDFEPHIVYTFTFVDKLWGRLAAARAKTPVILSSYRNSTTAYYEPWLCRLSTAVICNSRNLQDIYRRFYPRQDPARVRYLPNGIDLSSYDCRRDRLEARRRLGLPAEGLITAQVARLHPVKDHPTSLTAFAQVHAALPQARLILVGHGDPRPIQRLIEEKNLTGAVTILEPTAAVTDIYAAADLIMLSSLHEGLPRVLVEASACGRPLLGTRVGGVPEIIEDGVNGFLVPPAEPEALARAWRDILADEARRAEFGRAARRLVEERYTIEVMMAKLYALFDQYLAEKLGPGASQ